MIAYDNAVRVEKRKKKDSTLVVEAGRTVGPHPKFDPELNFGCGIGCRLSVRSKRFDYKVLTRAKWRTVTV